MRNAHVKYLCYPTVACVGKETEVTVYPRDLGYRFVEGKEYEVGVFGLREDQLDYHKYEPVYDLPCRVVGGTLKFRYTFTREQEYSVRFREKDGKLISVAMYAVKEDLFRLRPLKGDFHTHSYYSDGSDGVPMVPANYREEGFDVYALTDHNRMFTSLEQQKWFEGVELGICMMAGEEVHTPESGLHIVHIGGRESVCERYIHHRDQFYAEVAEIEKTMSDIPETYRYRMASAKWACDAIHEVGGIAIFAHPFWRPDLYNISEDFCELLFDSGYFDVFELYNGGYCHEDNMQNALWMEQVRKGNVLPIVSSSDCHNHDGAGYFGRAVTIVLAEDNTSDAVKKAILAGNTVAVEVSIHSDAEYRVYSNSYRLSAYARFLYEHYFNETWRLCVGEGILMRRYLWGEDVAEQLSALAPTVENFYKAFFGLAEAPTLSESAIKRLDELRQKQIERGPETSGSKLYVYGTNVRHE